MRKRINVLCVDDHQIVREGIVAVIGRQSDMQSPARPPTACRPSSVLQNPPDVTLMDRSCRCSVDSTRSPDPRADAQAKIISPTHQATKTSIRRCRRSGDLPLEEIRTG
jgi:DNA-binding NarL/FixJ family response regulator